MFKNQKVIYNGPITQRHIQQKTKREREVVGILWLVGQSTPQRSFWRAGVCWLISAPQALSTVFGMTRPPEETCLLSESKPLAASPRLGTSVIWCWAALPPSEPGSSSSTSVGFTMREGECFLPFFSLQRIFPLCRAGKISIFMSRARSTTPGEVP